MDDVFAVYELKSLTNAGSKKSYLLLCEFVFFADMIPQISPWHQVHYQVQSVSVLKRLSHVDQKFML